MLGSDFLRLLESSGADVTGFHRGNLDFCSSEAISEALATFDVVVNCIGYTQVDLAESQTEAATEANVEIPRRIIEAIGSSDTRLIHMSTDYVFSGSALDAYEAQSIKKPLSVYGRTKSLGEDIWLSGSENSQVIRTAWLYGANGGCFPKTVASKLLSGQALSVVDDQVGSPTWTCDLSNFISKVALAPIESRILHGVAGEVTTWFGFAKEIAESLDSLVPERIPEFTSSFKDLITPISTEDYPTAARRPRSSVLAQSSAGRFRIKDWRSGWATAAIEVLGDLLNNRAT